MQKIIKQNVKYAILIGEEEIKNNSCILKDITKKEETIYKTDDLLQNLRGRLSRLSEK